MASGPTPTANSDSGRGNIDRRQFLTATGVVGGSFLAGAGTSIFLSNCSGLPVLGGGDGDPIKLGAVYLRGGPAESLGPGPIAEVRLAVEKVNEGGGINDRNVELSFLAEGRNPTYAIDTLVEKFEVDALLGLSTSEGALKAAPKIEQLGIPVILTDVSTPFITEYDTGRYGNYYESEDGTAAASSSIFRTGANTSVTTYALAKFARENLDITRVAALGPDTLDGHQAWAYFKAYADGLGADYEYVTSAFPDLGASDMRPHIDAILDADPDLVFTSFWAGDAVTFVRQAVERGLFGQVDDVLDTLGADPRVFKALGDTMPLGVHYSSWYWYSAFNNQQNEDFISEWKSKYYRPVWHEDENKIINAPGPTGGSAWSAVFLYKQAMEAAGGTNSEAIITELEGAIFQEDPRGPTTIDSESHQANAPVVIGETSTNDDVFYRGDIGLERTETYTLDRSTAKTLLDGSDLPPGV